MSHMVPERFTLVLGFLLSLLVVVTKLGNSEQQSCVKRFSCKLPKTVSMWKFFSLDSQSMEWKLQYSQLAKKAIDSCECCQFFHKFSQSQ